MSKKIRNLIGEYIKISGQVEPYKKTSGWVGAYELYQYIDNIALLVITRHFDNLDKYDLYIDDLRNDIIIKVMDNIESLYKSDKIYTYIYTVSKNYVTDRIRRAEVNGRRWQRYVNYEHRVCRSYSTIDIDCISYCM